MGSSIISGIPLFASEVMLRPVQCSIIFILLLGSILGVWTKHVTVSAKIDEGLRRRLRELSIKPSEVIRRALEEEVERRTREELYKKVEGASRVISKAGRRNWVRAIRESSDEG